MGIMEWVFFYHLSVQPHEQLVGEREERKAQRPEKEE